MGLLLLQAGVGKEKPKTGKKNKQIHSAVPGLMHPGRNAQQSGLGQKRRAEQIKILTMIKRHQQRRHTHQPCPCIRKLIQVEGRHDLLPVHSIPSSLTFGPVSRRAGFRIPKQFHYMQFRRSWQAVTAPDLCRPRVRSCAGRSLSSPSPDSG